MSRSRYIADFIVSSNDIANSTITYVDIGTVFTSNIIENGDTTSGNLYFTNARVDARVATTSINSLYDVDTTGVASSQTLIWDGNKWIPGSPIVGATAFANVSNVANIVLSLEGLSTSNLVEGTNLYFTNARVFANVSGLLSAKVNSADLTTDNVRELSNLYYTNARVDARVATTSVNALVDVDITGITTNQSLIWDGSKFIPTTIATTSFANTALFANTSGFANVSNIANTVLSLTGLTTSNLAEGSNLYYTNTRVYSNVTSILTYYTGNISAGNINITGKFFGDGSGLTGIGPSALSGMATYAGNILAANITATSVTATNVYANSFISTGTGTPTLQSGTNINLTANNAVIVTNSVFRVRSYTDTDRNNNTIPQSGDIIFNSTSNVLQYYSNGAWISSANASALINAITTTNVNEGSNLYFTNARVVTGVTTANISNLVITGNILAGNVIASRIYGTFFGDGSALSGVGGGSGNFANTSNVANLVLSLNNFTTSNLSEGSNLYFTNARVVTGITTANISNLSITGNILAGNVVASRIYATFFGDGSGLTGVGGSANLAGMATYGGNILAANITANSIFATNVTVNNILSTTGGTITAGSSSNTVIIGGTYRSTFDDAGNVTLPNLTVLGNVVITGRYIGDGSALTGISAAALAGMATYAGNILAANITTTQFIVTPNLILGNAQSNARISFTNTSNVSLIATPYKLEVLNNGNVLVPNLVASGKIFGDGSGLTGISVAGLGLPTYNGNILVANLTASQFIVTPNLFLGNVQSNARISFTNTANVALIATPFKLEVLNNGNVLVPNLVVSGKIFGDGSGITNISTSLTGMATYAGNILAANITATTINTTNLYVSNIINLTGAPAISVTASSNTTIKHGSYTSQFLDNGNVSLPNLTVLGNVVVSGRFVGDGSGITGVSTSLAGLATYNGNILASNIVTNTITANSLVSTGGNISFIPGQNTIIFGGFYSTRFGDDGNVTLPNIVVQGRITGDGAGISNLSVAGLGLATYNGNILASNITTRTLTANTIVSSGGNISFLPGQNTVIFGGLFASTFNDVGNVILPNVVVQGKIFGDGSGITGISLASLNLATYAGNILASNITASQFIVTPNIFLGNNQSNSRISFTNTANISLIATPYKLEVLNNGNVLVPNLVVSGKIFGDGSAITNLSTAGLSLGTYNANILVANLTASQFIVTPNLFLGNTQSNARISFTNTANVSLIATPFRLDVLNNGNVLVPNLVASGKIFGDGSGLTGIITSLNNMATYGGNILASNITASSVTANTLSSFAGGNISFVPGGANTSIFGGLFRSLFADDGNVTLPNLIITSGTVRSSTGNVTLVGNIFANSISIGTLTGIGGGNISSRNDQNTIIYGGTFAYTFRDTGTLSTTNVLVTRGLYVGADSTTNRLLSDASTGAGTQTLYIGNQSITTSSDIRLKNILGNTTVQAVNVVSNLRVVDFTWNDSSDTSYNNKNARGMWTGLIAQEAIEHVPYVVNAVRDQNSLLPISDAKNEQGKDVYWGLEYDKLVPLLIKAVQEQQSMIDDLRARISALESNK